MDGWWDMMKLQFGGMEAQIAVAWSKYVNDKTDNPMLDFAIILCLELALMASVGYSDLILIPCVIVLLFMIAPLMKMMGDKK